MKKHLSLCIAFGCAFLFATTLTAQSFSISGTVEAEGSGQLANFSVVLLNSSNVVIDSIANVNGLYAFHGVAPGNYQLRLSKTDEPLNGVSSFDLALVGRHIIGIQPLGSPYKLLAADINRDGILSVWDMVYARMLILGIVPHFSDNQSWRFMRSDLSFDGVLQNPFQLAYGTLNTVTVTNSDTGIDFTAMKVFDVNSSAETGN